MGNPLNDVEWNAFSEELAKEAVNWGQVGNFVKTRLSAPSGFGLKTLGRIGRGTQGLAGDAAAAGKRMLNPIEGLREGWRQSSPMGRAIAQADKMGYKSRDAALSALGSQRDTLSKAIAAADAAGDVAKVKSLQKTMKKVQGDLGRVEFTGNLSHLNAPSVSLREAASTPGLRAKSRAIAEELSRRGITGQGGLGGATKYIPVGEKGQLGLWGAMAVPSIIDAQKPTPTSEGGALEHAGGLLGSTGGMVLGAGLGLVPAAALWLGSDYLGRKAGRFADRMRGGATPGQAAFAPSPEEAQNQMNTIRKYYG